MHTRRGSVQGYNAQAVTTTEQVIVAAELTQHANDLQQLAPMLAATTATLAAAGIPADPGGCWPTPATDDRQPDPAPRCAGAADPTGQARPPRQARKDGKPSASRSDALRAAMTAKLASDDGNACYAKRKQTIEPVFGQLKERQGRGSSCNGACRLPGGVEATVRHPQPAQAVAAHRHPASGQAGDHLTTPKTAHSHRDQRPPPGRARPPPRSPDASGR